MNSNFIYAVACAGKYEREEMLEYLLAKMSGIGSWADEQKVKVFIENMNKFTLEELEKRLGDKSF